MTINLRKKLVKLRTTRRRKKAVDYLREIIAKHSKTNIENVRISNELNDYLDVKVAKHMKRVKIVFDKSGDKVTANLSEELRKKAETKVPTTGKIATENKQVKPETAKIKTNSEKMEKNANTEVAKMQKTESTKTKPNNDKIQKQPKEQVKP